MCACVCVPFTGKFFCKPHFIHCKTNSQQRKRRAELKQQREVCFVSKVLVIQGRSPDGRQFSRAPPSQARVSVSDPGGTATHR